VDSPSSSGDSIQHGWAGQRHQLHNRGTMCTQRGGRSPDRRQCNLQQGERKDCRQAACIWMKEVEDSTERRKEWIPGRRDCTLF
jgi:hypothetical protein